MFEESPAVEDVKRALAMLVAEETASWSREIINIAYKATQDTDCAAAFVVANGPLRLNQAIDLAQRTDDQQLVREGQRVLAAFERFRCAATDGPNKPDDHFQFGHGMDLMEETKRSHR